MKTIAPAANGYEDGLGVGEQVAGRWQPAVTTRLEKWKEALREAPNRNLGHLDTTTGMAIFDGLSREDLLARAADLHRRKMDAFPGIERFPEIAGMDQYLDDRHRGFADGAGIDVREAYLEIYWKEMFFDYLAPRRAGQWEACSECWLPRTDRGPLLGNGRDDIATWYTDEPMGQDWPPPLQPPALASTVAVPAGPAGDGYRRYGQVNEAGLCLETGGGALYEFEVKREEEYFPAPVLDLVLRCCSTTIEAVEMLTRYNLHWGGCNLVVGDTSGMGALIEKSKYHYAVRMSDRNVLVSTYGGCDDPDMRRLCDTANPYFRYYERRVGIMRQILDAAVAAGVPTIDDFWASMLHHDEAAGGCQHRDCMPPGVELFTHAGTAILPEEGRRLSRSIATEKGEVRYPCSVPERETCWIFA